MKKLILLLLLLPLIGEGQTNIGAIHHGAKSIIINISDTSNEKQRLKEVLMKNSYYPVEAEGGLFKTDTRNLEEGIVAYYNVVKIDNKSIIIQTFLTQNKSIMGSSYFKDKMCKFTDSYALKTLGFMHGVDLARIINSYFNGSIIFK